MFHLRNDSPEDIYKFVVFLKAWSRELHYVQSLPEQSSLFLSSVYLLILPVKCYIRLCRFTFNPLVSPSCLSVSLKVWQKQQLVGARNIRKTILIKYPEEYLLYNGDILCLPFQNQWWLLSFFHCGYSWQGLLTVLEKESGQEPGMQYWAVKQLLSIKIKSLDFIGLWIQLVLHLAFCGTDLPALLSGRISLVVHYCCDSWNYSHFTYLPVEEKQLDTPSKKSPGFFSYFSYWKEAGKYYKLLVSGLLMFTLFNSSDAFLLLGVKHLGYDDQTMIGLYIFYNLIYALLSFPLGILADKIGNNT